MNFSKLIQKDHRALVKLADKWFSLYVRERDSEDGFGFCISCNRFIEAKYNDAGHFIPRQEMKVRFDPRNVHLQCKNCNKWQQGNAAGYREAIERKYGKGTADELYQLSKINIKFDRIELAGMVMAFRDQYNQLKNDSQNKYRKQVESDNTKGIAGRNDQAC